MKKCIIVWRFEVFFNVINDWILRCGWARLTTSDNGRWCWRFLISRHFDWHSFELISFQFKTTKYIHIYTHKQLSVSEYFFFSVILLCTSVHFYLLVHRLSKENKKKKKNHIWKMFVSCTINIGKKNTQTSICNFSHKIIIIYRGKKLHASNICSIFVFLFTLQSVQWICKYSQMSRRLSSLSSAAATVDQLFYLIKTTICS